MRISKIYRFTLLASVLLGCCLNVSAEDSSAYTGEVSFPGTSTFLPFTGGGVHPIVAANFGSDQELGFIVDTGASVNVIDESIAEEFGFEVIGHTEIGAPGGPQIPANIVIVPLVRVGNVDIVDAEFVTMDVLGFTRGKMHGVIGATLFTDYLLAFDWQAGHIELSHGELAKTDEGVVAYNAEDSQVGIDIQVGGGTIEAHVDTGSMGSFMLPGEMMADLPVTELPSPGKARLVGGNRDIKFGQLEGAIEFAGLEFVNPKIAFMTPSAGTGNIGSRVMQDYRVTLDLQKHLIRFEPSPANEIE